MNIPSEFRAGDTVKWRDNSTTDVFGNDIQSSNYTLTYYLRTNTASEGHSVVGTDYQDGWQFQIPSYTTSGFDSGTWYFQAVADGLGQKFTLASGSLKVLASLSYSGTPAAFDGRSQTKKDLEAVQTAIRTLISGGAVQEYKIGNRNLKRYDLGDLIQLEGRLKAEVKREDQAELIANGLGNPRQLYVRF